MSEVSRFFGINVRMFFEPRAQQNRPHFHAYHQGQVAILAIDTTEVIGGALPQKQRRLVEVWAELHRDELARNWEGLQAGRLPFKIAPLRERSVLAAHSIYRVTGFELAGPHTLNVSFDDGAARTIDFAPVLRGALYGPLRDRGMFESVRIDPESHTLAWPNGADFDPATLHDWPDVVEDFSAMVDRWADAGREEAG